MLAEALSGLPSSPARNRRANSSAPGRKRCWKQTPARTPGAFSRDGQGLRPRDAALQRLLDDHVLAGGGDAFGDGQVLARRCEDQHEVEARCGQQRIDAVEYRRGPARREGIAPRG